MTGASNRLAGNVLRLQDYGQMSSRWLVSVELIETSDQSGKGEQKAAP